MALTLLVKPANAGTWLCSSIVTSPIWRGACPDRADRVDVERVERDLLVRAGALLGSIGTFDDVFERIAAGNALRSRSPETRSARRSCAEWSGATLGSSTRRRDSRDS
jgi:hypothetical protein